MKQYLSPPSSKPFSVRMARVFLLSFHFKNSTLFDLSSATGFILLILQKEFDVEILILNNHKPVLWPK